MSVEQVQRGTRERGGVSSHLSDGTMALADRQQSCYTTAASQSLLSDDLSAVGLYGYWLRVWMRMLVRTSGADSGVNSLAACANFGVGFVRAAQWRGKLAGNFV